MSTITSLAVTPSTLAKGAKASVAVGLTNPDRVQKITGVDENGASVTGTYSVHTNLALVPVAAAQAIAAGGKAPAGTIVLWTDSPVDVLSVDPANPLGLILQT